MIPVTVAITVALLAFVNVLQPQTSATVDASQLPFGSPAEGSPIPSDQEIRALTVHLGMGALHEAGTFISRPLSATDCVV